MRIIGIHQENIKKVKLVDLSVGPDGVTISGANAQAKTSVLDGVRIALVGNDQKETPEPIRRGQSKAISLVSLGTPEYDEAGNEVACPLKLKVSRTFTANNRSYLKVATADGAEYKSPQAILDGIIGNLTFDPLAFSGQKEKDQLATLLALVNIPLDLKQWAADRKAAFDERTVVNREVSELETLVKEIDVPDDTPAEEISAASVLAEQREAQAVIDGNGAQRRSLKQLSSRVAALESQAQVIAKDIDRLEQELSNAREQLGATNAELATKNTEYDDLAKQVEALVDPDLSAFETRITEVESINRLVRAKNRRNEVTRRLLENRADSQTLTVKLAHMDGQRADALKAAQMPIEDLSFDDNGVLYKGIPFKQCSSAERLRVSIAMGMALNPKLRVIFVRDGSLLDSKHRAMIQEMAHDNQYQLWMEVTDDTGKGELVIEEGEIVSSSAPAATQASML
jgi:hypothetical protein